MQNRKKDLELITGLMGSGKTAKLLEMEEELHPNVAILKVVSPKKRTGEIEYVESRNGEKTTAICISTNQKEAIRNRILLENLVDKYENILIDEIHFLSPTMIIEVVELLKNRVNLYLFGLSIDFRGETFQSISKLIDTSNLTKIHTLKIKCQGDNCNDFASYNARMMGDKVLTTGDLIVEEKSIYKALCFDCYHSNKI